MKKCAGFVVTGFVALVVCSCAPQAELDRARAEAEAARAEAERARAEAERARAEADELRAKANAEEKARAEEAKQKQAQEKLMGEVMKRWNAAAGGVTVAWPGGGQLDFVWKDVDKFPHPTYKGGSAEAYGAFAGALLAFLQNDDNFDYLAKNKLFTAELRYNLLSGQVSKWTFAGLAEQLSGDKAHGNHDATARKSLKALAEKMKAPPKE
jgi:hypothetical protein